MGPLAVSDGCESYTKARSPGPQETLDSEARAGVCMSGGQGGGSEAQALAGLGEQSAGLGSGDSAFGDTCDLRQVIAPPGLSSFPFKRGRNTITCQRLRILGL